MLGKNNAIQSPHRITAVVNEQKVNLHPQGAGDWTYRDVRVSVSTTGIVTVMAPGVHLGSVQLEWEKHLKPDAMILNDHWERSYGDLSWHPQKSAEILPWYWAEYSGGQTNCYGVKTGAHSLCFWQISENVLSLTLDTRSGGNGVLLGDRTLRAAEIVTTSTKGFESPFQTMRRFTQMMCDQPRLPKQPVYGINDWYFSYGQNSAELIMAHTRMLAPLTEGLANRPFSLIDAGWYQKSPDPGVRGAWGDNMHTPVAEFGDMGVLADKIKKLGMRPGIWTRPLCGSHTASKSVMLPLIEGRNDAMPVLDPTITENQEYIKNYFKLYHDWGYELVKIDFTSYDLFGKWGFQMLTDGAITSANWHMHDQSKTNAEIMLDLYALMREAAGETYLLGCNTMSHLTAGLFEINRIGDDTSGLEWDRTLKMGVNTLAFRGVHHNAFYSVDADCIGLTDKVSWEKNKQWMELLAKSGTPLFISAQPTATGAIQKSVIKECFKLASQPLPLGEPLDWLVTETPQKWRLTDDIVTFDWK